MRKSEKKQFLRRCTNIRLVKFRAQQMADTMWRYTATTYTIPTRWRRQLSWYL